MKLSAKRINEMREMMLALTDQEGGVGMNESPDRLGQAVLQRLPCSSFKRQQTLRYILYLRPIAFLFIISRKYRIVIAILVDFLCAIDFQPKKMISEILLARCKQLFSYIDSMKEILVATIKNVDDCS